MIDRSGRGIGAPSDGAGSTSLVVFTGVDGALRDPATRSWAEAAAAVGTLSAQKVPLVLTSHHSAAELLRLQRELGLREPFICESGAALYIPKGYFADLPNLGRDAGEWEVIEFGERRQVVCDALYQIVDTLQVSVVGFSRLSAGELAQREGLSPLDAQLSLQREYDEPFEMAGASSRDRTRLFNAMRRAGFRCFSGPRFHFATGVQDPAHATRLLISLYRLHGDSVLVVGLGDDWADRVLLRAVDVPVVVRNVGIDQRRLLKRLPAAYLTHAAGPAGWSEAILGSVAA